jgi:hypothetical protein
MQRDKSLDGEMERNAKPNGVPPPLACSVGLYSEYSGSADGVPSKNLRRAILRLLYWLVAVLSKLLSAAVRLDFLR